VIITGRYAADFTVIAQPATSVRAGSSVTFQITFDPGDVGVRGAIINIIPNNDPNENPYDFRIQGTGVAGS